MDAGLHRMDAARPRILPRGPDPLPMPAPAASIRCLPVLALLACWCHGAHAAAQSVLHPRGPVAATIADLWWIMLVGGAAVLAIVMIALLWALFRRSEDERRVARWLIPAGGLAFPAVVLTALLVHGTREGDRIARAPADEPLRIDVIAHQWWWEVHYPPREGADAVFTANEVHVPAGRPIEVRLGSGDVIHSFWVPALAGKLDAIPGRINTLRFSADAPGRFRGQCSEFCGAQHSLMAFEVIAHAPADFERWLAAQQRDAVPPATPAQHRGRALFQAMGCPECHRVRGTDADGALAPDLTHVGSRRLIAAGTLVRHRDTLSQWIRHNQRLKPGNRMLGFEHMDAATADAIAAWLDSLDPLRTGAGGDAPIAAAGPEDAR